MASPHPEAASGPRQQRGGAPRTPEVSVVRDALAAGVPKHRLYRADVRRPLRGVVLLRGGGDQAAAGSEDRVFAERVAAVRAILRSGQFLSRRTAAQLQGFPGVRATEAGTRALDVGAVRPTRPPQRTGALMGHQVGPAVLRTLPSPPLWLPAPCDTWALLAAGSSVRDLVVLGDWLVSGSTRWEEPLATRQDLAAAVTRFRGTVGIERLKRALEQVREGVESPAESRLRLEIVGSGLPEPVTSCPVPVWRRRLRADLGYPEWRIAIEYEGAYHFTGGVEQARRDVERMEMMVAAGWRVLRATARDLRNPRPFLERLESALAERSGENPRTFVAGNPG